MSRKVVAYSNTDVTQADPAIVQLAEEGKIDWVAVTSSATAASLANLFGDAMNRMKIASLSPVTSKSIGELGYSVAAEADPHTMDSLVDSIVEAS